MCQIQIVKRLDNKKLSENELNEFIKLMALGNMNNHHAFGVFNNKYLLKGAGNFNYIRINDKKVLKEDFLIGHNRLTTTGRSYTKKEIEEPTNKFFNTLSFGMLERCFSKRVQKNYNNHPFRLGDFVMVHNGTIWNHKRLRKKFEIDSRVETDSYIIIHLINKFFKESKKRIRNERIVEAIKKTTQQIEGGFSVMLFDNVSKKIFYFRNDCNFFTFSLIGKDILIGSTMEKNLDCVYLNKSSKKRIRTYPNNIYLIGESKKYPVKKIGSFEEFPIVKLTELKGGKKKDEFKNNRWYKDRFRKLSRKH